MATEAIDIVTDQLDKEIAYLEENRIYFLGGGLADWLINRLKRRKENIQALLLMEDEERVVVSAGAHLRAHDAV